MMPTAELEHTFIFLIPTYNRAELLKRAIASILNNGYSNVVAYICNDGSTDHTAEVEDYYKGNKKVRWTNLKENSGTNQARNALLDQIQENQAVGFVCMMDDEDVLIPDVLPQVNRMINAHPQYAWFVGHSLNQQGQKSGRIKKYGVHNYAESWLVHHALGGDMFQMIHTRIIGKKDRFTTLVKNAEEWYFFCQIARAHRLFAFDVAVFKKEYLPTGLTHMGYNRDAANRVIVAQLKVDTFSQLINDDKTLHRHRLLLAYALLNNRQFAEARHIFSQVPLMPCLRLIFYQLKRKARQFLRLPLKIKHINALYQKLKQKIHGTIWNYTAKRAFKKTFKPYRSVKERFEFIYNENYWGSKETKSGLGSEIAQTRTLVERLNMILSEFKIKNMLDVPCGDFNWMKNVNLKNVSYSGFDIVEDIIKENRRKYASDNIFFSKLDIINDELPQADLVFVRDCFIHFSFEDIWRALENIKSSNSKYLLTTSYVRKNKNKDIPTGSWRRLNLEAKPFSFKPALITMNEKYTERNGKDYGKSICLWEVKEIDLSKNHKRLNL